MPRTLTASDRKSLIRLASSLPKGDKLRRVILTELIRAASRYKVRDWNKYIGKTMRSKDEKITFVVLPPQPPHTDKLAYKLLEDFEVFPAGKVLFEDFMPDDGGRRWKVEDVWELL